MLGPLDCPQFDRYNGKEEFDIVSDVMFEISILDGAGHVCSVLKEDLFIYKEIARIIKEDRGLL